MALGEVKGMNKEVYNNLSEELDNSLVGDEELLNKHEYEKSIEASTRKEREEVSRLEFTNKTKRILAQRVGYRCSFPDCNVTTVGPNDSQYGITLLGEAAHIIGAVKGSRLSPRVGTTEDEKYIRSIQNGIWLCRNHHKLIDSRECTYSIEQLKMWKINAEKRQSSLLEVAPSQFVEKYVFPKINIEKGINTEDFTDKEWCLLMYLADNYNHDIFEFNDDDRPFEEDYQNWMSVNNIDSKVSGLVFGCDYYYTEKNARIRDVVNNLTGLVFMDNYCIKKGKMFEDFFELLLKEDGDAINNIKKLLAKV